MMKFAMVIFAGLLLLVMSAAAQEKKIRKSDLPPAVQKAADEQSKGAAVKGYAKEVENGKTEYEVQLNVNGHSKDLTMDEQGNVLEVEEEVAISSLPDAVHKGLTEKAGKGRIIKVESLTRQGRLVAYEAQVRNGAKRSEVQVGPDGKPLDYKE